LFEQEFNKKDVLLIQNSTSVK